MTENGNEFGDEYFNKGCIRLSRSLTRSLYDGQVVSWLKRKAPQALSGTGRRALEIGCGYGYASELLAERGFNVLATDISTHAIDRAREEVRVPSIEFAVWDASTELREDSFDFIMALEVIEHLPDPEAALRNWAGLLRPHGVLVCTTPNRYGPLSRYKRDPTHINVRSQSAWRRTFTGVAEWDRVSIGATQFLPWTWRLDGVMRTFPLVAVGSNLRILGIRS